MKRIFLAFFTLAAIALTPLAGADTKIQIVTTIPDLADMTRRVGGEVVEVTSLTTGVENIHAVPMKPSFAVTLNRADLLIVIGLDAEHAFLPGLLEAARNPKIMPGAPGYIDVSVNILPLEVPTRIDRSLGEQHPMGNPHFNLDPVAGKDMARAIADGLSLNYPQYASTFKKNLAAYLAELDAAIARWEKDATPLRGVKLVSYHPDLIYFAERFGMEPVGMIELRPGVDPTPAHIVDLEQRMREEKVPIVVRELHYPAALAETIAQATGAQVVELPVMAGGLPETKTYIDFINYNVRTMLNAVQGRARTVLEPDPSQSGR